MSSSHGPDFHGNLIACTSFTACHMYCIAVNSCVNTGIQYSAMACISGGMNSLFLSTILPEVLDIFFLKSWCTLAKLQRCCYLCGTGRSSGMPRHNLRCRGSDGGEKTAFTHSMQAIDTSLPPSICTDIANRSSTNHPSTSSAINRRPSIAQGMILYISLSRREADTLGLWRDSNREGGVALSVRFSWAESLLTGGKGRRIATFLICTTCW